MKRDKRKLYTDSLIQKQIEFFPFTEDTLDATERVVLNQLGVYSIANVINSDDEYFNWGSEEAEERCQLVRQRFALAHYLGWQHANDKDFINNYWSIEQRVKNIRLLINPITARSRYSPIDESDMRQYKLFRQILIDCASIERKGKRGKPKYGDLGRNTPFGLGTGNCFMMLREDVMAHRAFKELASINDFNDDDIKWFTIRLQNFCGLNVKLFGKKVNGVQPKIRIIDDIDARSIKPLVLMYFDSSRFYINGVDYREAFDSKISGLEATKILLHPLNTMIGPNNYKKNLYEERPQILTDYDFDMLRKSHVGGSIHY